MTERFEQGCLLLDGCPDRTKCRHRCLEAVNNPLLSSDGSFMRMMLADVPSEILKPREIDFKAWNELCTVSKNRPVGFTKGGE